MNSMQSSRAVIRFPAFTAGSPEAARAGLGALAGVLAKRYAATGSFVGSRVHPTVEKVDPDELLPVADGSLVFLNDASDFTLVPGTYRKGYRLYLVSELQSEICRVLGWCDCELIYAAFEAAILDSPWGSLALTVSWRVPYTATALRERFSVILRDWDALARLRYVDVSVTPRSLEDIINERCANLVTMWLPEERAGDPRRNILAALDALETADSEERMTRSIALLVALVSRNPRIHHKEALTDISFLREQLAMLEPHEREALEAGEVGPTLPSIYAADREFKPKYN